MIRLPSSATIIALLLSGAILQPPSSAQAEKRDAELSELITAFAYDSGGLYWLEEGCGVPDANRLRVDLIDVLSPFLVPASIETNLARFEDEYRRRGGGGHLECHPDWLATERKLYLLKKEQLQRWKR